MTSKAQRSPKAALSAVCLLIALAFPTAPVAGASFAPPPETTSVAVEKTPKRDKGFFRWPTAGRLTQDFGCTRFRMNSRRGRCAFFHNGLDIANRRGTRIHAAAGGVVTHVGWDPYDRSRDRAWVVIIRHRNGVKSWYAHLLPRRVRGAREGDRVRRGQLIGFMGQTGKATGVHLHFMAQVDGRFVNPRRFLPAGSRKPPKPGSRHGAAHLAVMWVESRRTGPV